MDEAVTAEELIRDRRGEPLVKGFAGGAVLGEHFGGLGCSRLLERRGVHDRPKSQKASEHLRQELEVAVLALAQPPVVVDGLSQAVDRARSRRILGGVGQVALDGVLDDRALGASGRRAVREQALSKWMAEARVDAHAPRLGCAGTGGGRAHNKTRSGGVRGSGSTWPHAAARGEWVSVQGRGLAAEDPGNGPAHRAPPPRSGRAGRAPRASPERGRSACRSRRRNKPTPQAPHERGR
jgi:hypothetical protein